MGLAEQSTGTSAGIDAGDAALLARGLKRNPIFVIYRFVCLTLFASRVLDNGIPQAR
jgi:hypothetical protein